MALFVKRFNKFMSKKSCGKKGQAMARKVNSQRTILFVNKKCFECGEEGHIVINCPNKKNDKTRRGRKMMIRKRRNSSRGKRMAEPILLSGIPMQAPMMMMTSHPKVLPESPSRRLLHSSPHHIVLWQRVVQR